MMKTVLVVAATIAITTPARALDLTLLGASLSESDTSYAYHGYLKQSERFKPFGKNMRYRLWADYLKYDYETDAGTMITAKGPGLSLGLQIFESNADYEWSLGGGVQYRNLSLSDDDPTSDSAGGHARLYLGLSGTYNFNEKFGVYGSGSFTPTNDGYWTYYRAFRRFESNRYTSFGLDLGFSGADTYESQSVGFSVQGLPISKSKWSFSFRAGLQGESDFDDEFVGISFVRLH